jgi:alpha-tubulin suppressor-like RCC1 family protein
MGGLKVSAMTWVAFGLVACGGGGEEEHQALANVAEVAVGMNHACARLRTGQVSCWGAAYAGGLGDGTGTDTTTPTPVAARDISNATEIAANAHHSLALLSDGTVRGWGLTYSDSTSPFPVPIVTLVPTPVPTISAATAISTGDQNHSCAIVSGGEVYCWGWGIAGQLGDGSMMASLTPVRVTGITDAVSVSVNDSASCVVHRDGRVSCWGSGIFYGIDGSVPMDADGVTDAVAVSVGDYYACALRATGTVSCWGFGSLFNLGTGLAPGINSVVDVPGVSNVVSISAGGFNMCAGVGVTINLVNSAAVKLATRRYRRSRCLACRPPRA